MVYINVDPITRKVKEYANSGEWMAAVEKATSGPKPKPVKKMTYAEASKKLREEAGIDLRSPAERQQAEIDGLMTETRAFEAEQRAAREQRYAYQEGTEGEDEAEDGAEPLDEVQRRQEEL